ncbi:ABC transporter C family member 13 [Artemisia annua]|uniref:ABC transporter C family member 13 n=1 Tax=Artemisia annua TaxID=35608 RepID=A0A2U1KVT8_ARTAN|nr:ABC transporter C family member 13 [Artemisia annua]
MDLFDVYKYYDVLEVCALDIDVSHMVGCDMAYIEEKGLNLFVGQRAHLALSRSYCDVTWSISILQGTFSDVATFQFPYNYESLALLFGA